MATRDEVARQPLEQRRARLALTPDELAAGIHGQPEAVLGRRPEATSWAAKEIICHLRDTEEMFLLRLEAIAAVDEPLIAAAGMGARMLALKPDGQPAAPDRWAEDRQYLRNDAAEALATFRRLREGTLAHLTALSPEQWHRGGVHPRRGRLTVEDFVTDMAWHDDNHLDQFRRARGKRVIEECRSIVAGPSTLDAARTITLIRSAPQALGGALIDRDGWERTNSRAHKGSAANMSGLRWGRSVHGPVPAT